MSYIKRWIEDVYYNQISKGIPIEEICSRNDLTEQEVNNIKEMFESPN